MNEISKMMSEGEINNMIIKEQMAERDRLRDKAQAEADRAELWQRAAQDALDQVAALKQRAEDAETGRENWMKEADRLKERLSAASCSAPATKTPQADDEALGWLVYRNLRYEVLAANLDVRLHDRGLVLIAERPYWEGGADVVRISMANGKVYEGRFAQRSPYVNGVCAVFLSDLALIEDCGKKVEPVADRFACLCGLNGTDALFNPKSLCPTCTDLVTHRGEEGGEGAEWGRCVECKADRHVWRVHTAADPCGSLVCGHCMALDLAHKANHADQPIRVTVTERLPAKLQDVSINLTITSDGVSVDGHPSPTALAESAQDIAKQTGDHLDDLAGRMGY